MRMDVHLFSKHLLRAVVDKGPLRRFFFTFCSVVNMEICCISHNSEWTYLSRFLFRNVSYKSIWQSFVFSMLLLLFEEGRYRYSVAQPYWSEFSSSIYIFYLSKFFSEWFFLLLLILSILNMSIMWFFDDGTVALNTSFCCECDLKK